MKVRCIDDKDLPPHGIGKIIKDHIYEANHSYGMYQIDSDYFAETRFVKIIKVKCIDARDVYLTVDKIYEAWNTGAVLYNLVDDNGIEREFLIRRFIEMMDQIPDTMRSAVLASPVASSPPKDKEEERMRRILTSTTPGNCSKCNSPRPCNMHPGLEAC